MRIPLKAWFFRATIDLKTLKGKFPESQIIGDNLLIPFAEGRQVCLTDFGGLVFWPFDEEAAEQVTATIAPTLRDTHLVKEVEDRLAVDTEQPENRVLFNHVELQGSASPDRVALISRLLAQSVALEYLELQADDALVTFEGYLEEVRARGHIHLPRKQIMKALAFAMETRLAVINNLALFDKPEATWESESLEKLYLKLHDFFELEDRQETLDRKLGFISESTSLIFEVLSTRKGMRLEWTIIILIAIEILLFIYELLR